MDRYPLKVTIPRAEVRRGKMFLSSHMDYVICIDDCGQAYPERFRRYKTFLWLHGQLKRQNLTCRLPELPPKKKVGNMEESFVETRRQQLESYLQALLRYAEVIRNDFLWLFLDADKATIAVPRFLCRSPAPAQCADCLSELKLVAEGDGIFRLCNSAVTDELAKFVRDEAASPIVFTSGMQRPHQDPRLLSRLRLCVVLYNLLQNERAKTARVHLQAANVFGALLELLHRATEDGARAKEIIRDYGIEELTSSQSGQYPVSESTRNACAVHDLHNRVIDQVALCLTVLIEQTRGAALVSFCQQDGGLEKLRNLCETHRLHLAAASLLWHAIQHESVIHPLTSKAAGGIALLEKLMHSHDLKARIVAALCIGNIVRSECGLSQQERKELLDRVDKTGILTTLVQEEKDAIQRGACHAIKFTDEAYDIGPFATQLNPVRDPKMSGLLEWLCRNDGITNLVPLLGGTGGHAGDGFDSVSALVVAILDHYALHADPVDLIALAPLEDQLRRLVNAAAEAMRDAANAPAAGAGGGGGGSSAAGAEEEEQEEQEHREATSIRAARVLVRFWGTSAESHESPELAPAIGPNGEMLALDLCVSRANALQILTRYSEYCQERSIQGLEATRAKEEEQRQQVESGNLKAPPCVPEPRIAEFAKKVVTLASAREDLSRKLDGAHEAMKSTAERLDQRGTQHSTFKGEVDLLSQELHSQTVVEHSTQMAASQAKKSEAEVAAAENEVAKAKKSVRGADEHLQRCIDLAKEAKGKVDTLEQECRQFKEILRTAPTDLTREHQSFQQVSQELEAQLEELSALESEIDWGERRVRTLGAGLQEADTAIIGMTEMRRKIKDFKVSLKSEVFLSEDEMEKLKEMESNCPRARPTRVRRTTLEDTTAKPGGDDEVTSSGGDFFADPKAPTWEDDIRREQEYRDEPHFRSFAALMEHREKLWKQELEWLKDVQARQEEQLKVQAESKAELQDKAKELSQRKQRLQERVDFLGDQDGHKQRHEEACEKVQRAAREVNSVEEEVDKAQQQLSTAEAAKKVAEDARAEAEEERAKTGECAVVETEKCRRSRQLLDERIRKLLDTARNQLQDWQDFDLRRKCVELLQDRVAEQIVLEKEDRDALRNEVRLLIDKLRELDLQLQDDDEGPSPSPAPQTTPGQSSLPC